MRILTIAIALTYLSSNALSQDLTAATTSPALLLKQCDAAADIWTMARSVDRDAISPDYPAEMSFRFTVSADGRATNAEIISSTASGKVTRLAMRELQKCPFSPANKGGIPMQGIATFHMRFGGIGMKGLNESRCPYPDYPITALSEGRRGTVRVKVRFEQDGSLRLESLLESSGHSDLDNAVISIVPKCDYDPKVRNAADFRELGEISYTFTH